MIRDAFGINHVQTLRLFYEETIHHEKEPSKISLLPTPCES